MKKGTLDAFSLVIYGSICLVILFVSLAIMYSFSKYALSPSTQEIDQMSASTAHTLFILNYLRLPVTIEDTPMTMGDYIASLPDHPSTDLNTLTHETLADPNACFALRDEGAELAFYCPNAIKRYAIKEKAVYQGKYSSSNRLQPAHKATVDLPLPDRTNMPLHFDFY